MATHFASIADGPVRRLEAPGLHALNFVIENAPSGGGMASLRLDPQGKAYGQCALEMMIGVPSSLLQVAERWQELPAGDVRPDAMAAAASG